MVIGVVKIPANEGEGIGFVEKRKMLVESYGVAVGVEGPLGVGGPALMESFKYNKVGKAGTASREAYLESVDDAVC